MPCCMRCYHHRNKEATCIETRRKLPETRTAACIKRAAPVGRVVEDGGDSATLLHVGLGLPIGRAATPPAARQFLRLQLRRVGPAHLQALLFHFSSNILVLLVHNDLSRQ